jgi:two-component sensor histidine kinase
VSDPSPASSVCQPVRVATLAELARQHTRLSRAQAVHLQSLVSDWGMLADFCFADLLLYAPAEDGWVVLGHVRPVTSQTVHSEDWVGTVTLDANPAVDTAYRSGGIVEGDVEIAGLDAPARMLAVPVRHEGEVIAVLTREWSPAVGRQPGQLERTYLDIFRRFTGMIADGTFPFPAWTRSTNSPRVGDGVIVLDAAGTVTYASPNAVSALHRMGINANAAGLRLFELGFPDAPVRRALDTGRPVVEELEHTPDVVLLVRSIPLVESARVTGAVILLRDVSEVRRRDRMIMTKDATIREIHHRVKNNLQTISSLLRLQGRRLSSPEAKAAIEESVRRIRTIALVHETLSGESGDGVEFAEIVRPLTRMAEDSLQSPDRPVRFRLRGEGGLLPPSIATPLAVVLTELLQNAVDHAFPGAERPGNVVVQLANDGHQLSVAVVDDGQGLPEGFALDQSTKLGLSIVRTLVTTELAGTIEMRSATDDDLAAAGLEGSAGTVVELRIPLDDEAG